MCTVGSMNTKYPTIEKRKQRQEQALRLYAIGKVLEELDPPPVRKVCIRCQEATQVKNKRCKACQTS